MDRRFFLKSAAAVAAGAQVALIPLLASGPSPAVGFAFERSLAAGMMTVVNYEGGPMPVLPADAAG